MKKKLILGLAGLFVVIIIFLAYVASRPDTFIYERHGFIMAPAKKIFPYLVSFKMGEKWNPYDQKDPNMKKAYSGEDGKEGSTMEFEGSSATGSGKLQITKIDINHQVYFTLTMTKPMQSSAYVVYRLSQDAPNRTLFSWTMTGKQGFLGKLFGVLFNCEKMIGKDFEEGIKNLKTLVEEEK